MNLDGFAAVPSGLGELVELPIAFGDELVVYSIGPASCAVPGLPAALGELLGAPRTASLEAAVRAGARTGAQRRRPLPGDARALARDARRALLPRARRRPLRPATGALLRGGRASSSSRESCRRSRRSRRKARRASTAGSIAEALLGVDGVVVTADDLAGVPRASGAIPWWSSSTGVASPPAAASRGSRSSSRASPASPGCTATERVLALVEALETRPRAASTRRTWSRSTRTGARASSRTRSASAPAVWLPGFDVQLNNLLGESDIAFGEPKPGDHLESRMAPTLVFDSDGLELAIGSAGATRLRTALATVLAAILDEGLDAETAVALPRVHPTLDARRRRAGSRRGRARAARGERPHRAPLGAPPPLLRRRQLRRASGRAGDPRRSGAPSCRATLCGRGKPRPYFSSSLSMRRDETYIPTSPIAAR